MAEGAFALSPLSASARSAAPTDDDYEAIRDAFMETARGRWFLGEYAKRNRNADTAMVLDAVARIEQSMAATKAEQAATPEPPSPAPALTALRNARSTIAAILIEPLFEDSLSRWHRSSRIIQEIAWALRETGSDPRICDILESQVRNIEETCDQFPSHGFKHSVLSALDEAIEELSPGLDADSPAEKSTNADAEKGQAGDPRTGAGVLAAGDLPSAEAGSISETSAMDDTIDWSDAGDQSGPEIAATSESAVEPVTFLAPANMTAAMPVAAEIMQEPEPAITPEPAVEAAIALPEPTHPPASDAAPAQAASLGESLIAQGLVKRPLSGRTDPLAPIRRMSQAEKIAFFS
ncbi:MAG: hypothetical protein K2W78_13160 [Xanthobacteraceae bacterium]|nr:hypothetical protein [Xanthobacteraceae bacterium]